MLEPNFKEADGLGITQISKTISNMDPAEWRSWETLLLMYTYVPPREICMTVCIFLVWGVH